MNNAIGHSVKALWTRLFSKKQQPVYVVTITPLGKEMAEWLRKNGWPKL